MENITTIQIHNTTKQKLESLKDYARETYEEVIAKLIDLVTEEHMELSEETKKAIEESRKQIREGKFYTLEEIKTRHKLK